MKYISLIAAAASDDDGLHSLTSDTKCCRGAYNRAPAMLLSVGWLVLPDRIELSTSPLPRECSTTELRQRPEAAGLGGAGYAIAPEPVQPLPPAETGVPRQLAAGRRVCPRFGPAGRGEQEGP